MVDDSSRKTSKRNRKPKTVNPALTTTTPAKGEIPTGPEASKTATAKGDALGSATNSGNEEHARKTKKRKHVDGPMAVVVEENVSKKKRHHSEKIPEAPSCSISNESSASEHTNEKRCNDDAQPHGQPQVMLEEMITVAGGVAQGSGDGTIEQDGVDGSRKKKKKKKKQDFSPAAVPLADPSDDATLSDQARKALTYAYGQLDTPEKWKFNKARQNWLLRNIWSEQTIPETHTTLVYRYITGIKGGVRETLVKTCKTVLSPPELAVTEPTASEPAATDADSLPSQTQSASPQAPQQVDPQTRQTRARAILAVLAGSEDI